MKTSEMIEILRREYGIENEQEFEEKIARSAGINVGIFTAERPERKDHESSEICA